MPATKQRLGFLDKKKKKYTYHFKMTAIIIQNDSFHVVEITLLQKTHPACRRVSMTSRTRPSFVYQPTCNKISSYSNIRQKFRGI